MSSFARETEIILSMLNVVYCVSLVWESLFILCSNIKANKVIAEQSLKAALKKKVCLTEFVSFKKAWNESSWLHDYENHTQREV